MTDILIRINDSEFRAPDEPTLQAWHRDGRVPDHALVWMPGMNSWIRAGELPLLNPSGTSRPRLEALPGEWHISQSGSSFVAENFAMLKLWYREGRIHDGALVYHPELQKWTQIATLPGLGLPASDVLLAMPATYRTGIQGHDNEAKGTVTLCAAGFEFHGTGCHFDVPFERIFDVRLENFRPSGFRSIIAGPAAVVSQNVKNIVAIDYLNTDEVERTAEFQIHGALTLMGEGEKAAGFRNRFLSFKTRFARRGMPAKMQVANADVATRLASLKGLFDSGLISEAEFAEKRGEILKAM